MPDPAPAEARTQDDFTDKVSVSGVPSVDAHWSELLCYWQSRQAAVAGMTRGQWYQPHLGHGDGRYASFDLAIGLQYARLRHADDREQLQTEFVDLARRIGASAGMPQRLSGSGDPPRQLSGVVGVPLLAAQRVARDTQQRLATDVGDGLCAELLGELIGVLWPEQYRACKPAKVEGRRIDIERALALHRHVTRLHYERQVRVLPHLVRLGVCQRGEYPAAIQHVLRVAIQEPGLTR